MIIKKEIKDWIQLIEQEKIKLLKEIVAFNFGILEVENGYMIYLMGAKEYSKDNDDWACEEDFYPVHKYLQLPEELKDKTWNEIQKTMETVLTELYKEGEFDNTFMRNAIAITTGFDDGELKRIK